MKVDLLDTDATAGRQRGRCDAQETWMPQAARAAPAAGRSACRHRPSYPGRREPFSADSPADSAEAACEACTKRFYGNVAAYSRRQNRR